MNTYIVRDGKTKEYLETIKVNNFEVLRIFLEAKYGNKFLCIECQ